MILATDGLFDNVDVDEICSIVLKWEQANHFIDGGIEERERRWAKGEAREYREGHTVTDLAEEVRSALVVLAQSRRRTTVNPC